MMRAIAFWVVVFLCPILGVSVRASGDSTAPKKPLDLPAGKKATHDEQEEDVPETVQFYGSEIEAITFLWNFPAYSFCGSDEVWMSLKGEVQAAVQQLSNRAKFTLVAYNTQTYVWKYKVQRASAYNKAAACAWMDLLQTAESECLADAGLQTIQICNKAPGRDKLMIFMGGNHPECLSLGEGSEETPEESFDYAAMCLTEITGANVKRVPINTVYVSTVYGMIGEQFWKDLAAANGGRSQIVP